MTIYAHVSPRMLPLCPDCLKKGKFKRCSSFSKTCGPHKAAQVRRENLEHDRQSKENRRLIAEERQTSLDPSDALDKIRSWFLEKQSSAEAGIQRFRMEVAEAVVLEHTLAWRSPGVVQAEAFLGHLNKFIRDLVAMKERDGVAGIIECVEYHRAEHTKRLVKGYEWRLSSTSISHNMVELSKGMARTEFLGQLEHWEWDRIKERLLLWQEQQTDVTLGDYT